MRLNWLSNCLSNWLQISTADFGAPNRNNISHRDELQIAKGSLQKGILISTRYRCRLVTFASYYVPSIIIISIKLFIK